MDERRREAARWLHSLKSSNADHISSKAGHSHRAVSTTSRARSALRAPGANTPRAALRLPLLHAARQARLQANRFRHAAPSTPKGVLRRRVDIGRCHEANPPKNAQRASASANRTANGESAMRFGHLALIPYFVVSATACSAAVEPSGPGDPAQSANGDD